MFNKFSENSFLWDDVNKYDKAKHATDANIIRRIHCACWTTKITDTHSEYVIIIAFLRQKL